MPKLKRCRLVLWGFPSLLLLWFNPSGLHKSGYSEWVVDDGIRHLALKKPPDRLVFYNMENFFHPSDDSLKADEDFTPYGVYHWTYNRYNAKIQRMGKTLVAIGEGRMPALIGVCEIENRIVLADLLNKSIIRGHPYRFIHKESPDVRGIDVALIYDPEVFQPSTFCFLNVDPEEFPDLTTRDILHVTGTFYNLAKCHIFINHWPSRRGGKIESDGKRRIMAKRLKQVIDSCFNFDHRSNIIIMGDFNDEPVDVSIRNFLGAADPKEDKDSSRLMNLMFPLFRQGKGSHYRVNNFLESSLLDQIIVSRAVYYGDNGLMILNGSGNIYQNEFLLDKKNGKPLRTFQGLKYLGGFSDHLPVFTDIQMLK